MIKHLRFLVSLLLGLLFFAQVQAQAPSSLQYPTPSGFIANVSNVFLSPTYAGPTATSFSITPALPAGLTFSTNTGVISGVPTAASVSTNYTVTATNAIGSKSTVVAITVSSSFFNNNFNPVAFRAADAVQKVGNGRSAGNIVLYQNVTTANGQAIDCIVKTVSVSTGTTWTAYDQSAVSGNGYDSNNDSFFSPQLTFPAGTASGGGGNIIFNFQFIAGGTYNNTSNTGTNVTLQNIRLNSYDIDGNGANFSNQYNRFNGFDSSELSSATTIVAPTLNAATGLTQFISNITANSSTVTAAATRVRLSYSNMSNFTIQVGGGGASYFFLDFSAGPAFTTAVVTSSPAIDLNTSIPGVGNGGTGCASPIAFVPASQTNLAGNANLNRLVLIYQNNTTNLPDGANETLKFNGTITGTASYALNFTGTPANTTTTIGGVSYTVARMGVANGTDTISFSKTNFTVAEGNALLKALRYDNDAANPTAGSRQFTINVENSAFRSPDAIFTATINCVAISGNIFHDANGLRDGIVNSNFNTGTALPVNSTYAVLTTPAGVVLASTAIAADGSYNFGKNDPGSYIIYVRNATAAVNTTITAPRLC